MTQSIDLNAIKGRLASGTGGYEVAHTSPGLELGVYVLVLFARSHEAGAG